MRYLQHLHSEMRKDGNVYFTEGYLVISKENVNILVYKVFFEAFQ